MAIWNHVKAGSGSPVLYGCATINVEKPLIQNNIYHPDVNYEKTVIAPSGSLDYFDMLDDRFKTPPSGWSAI